MQNSSIQNHASASSSNPKMSRLLLTPLPHRPSTFTRFQPNHSSLLFKTPSTAHPITKFSRVLCSNPTERSAETQSEEGLEKEEGLRWDVPWDWKVTAFVMSPYLMSIIFTGVVKSAGPAGMLQPNSEVVLTHLQSTDEVAIRMFADQLLKSVAKLSILYFFVSQHRPFPDGIFALRWEKPFNPQNGWILWTVGGLTSASIAVFLLNTFISGPSAAQTPNEAESLVQLLPLIGSSNISTVCLLGILGILAPICEETLYRGFFLTSLTKWFPPPLSIALSSAVFALAHQSPGKFLEIFLLGITLGAIYARTRNLLIPIAMHACWNSGVILLLTYLRHEGLDIQKYVQ